ELLVESYLERGFHAEIVPTPNGVHPSAKWSVPGRLDVTIARVEAQPIRSLPFPSPACGRGQGEGKPTKSFPHPPPAPSPASGEGKSSHPELFPEIDLAHLLVGQDLGRRALRQHGAFAHDVRALADAERLAHVVVRDQDADPARLQLQHDALDV